MTAAALWGGLSSAAQADTPENRHDCCPTTVVYNIYGDGNLVGHHIIVGNGNNAYSHNGGKDHTNIGNGNNSSGNTDREPPS
ncbi:hypothetical protein [Streptomyces flavofungini]|uniref:hypothetical protein n=1 Tax=Streptomyces flavofungini TaxID=68200 RepID=UPI0025B0AA87|nr:hypothetical protein [Streptomyces flavofungini]WJV47105.1 hypothetical protein QUY26_17200 [Streptomyces flavofungini]